MMTPERKAEIAVLVEPYTKRRVLDVYDPAIGNFRQVVSEDGRAMHFERIIPSTGPELLNCAPDLWEEVNALENELQSLRARIADLKEVLSVRLPLDAPKPAWVHDYAENVVDPCDGEPAIDIWWYGIDLRDTRALVVEAYERGMCHAHTVTIARATPAEDVRALCARLGKAQAGIVIEDGTISCPGNAP